MPFMRQPPAPKGDLRALWNLLGIRLVSLPARAQGLGGGSSGEATAIVWQDYTPHPEDGELQNEYVWVSPACDTDGTPLNAEESVSSGLQKLLFLYPGAIEDVGTDLGREFVPLVTMGQRTGTVRFDECVTRNLFGQMDLRSRGQIKEFEEPTGNRYVLAAAIRTQAGAQEANDQKTAGGLNVVVVSDMDILAGVFFLLRERASFFGEPRAGRVV